MTENRNKSYSRKYKSKKKRAAFVTPPNRGSLSGLTRAINKEKKAFFSEHIKRKIEDSLPMGYKAHSKLLASAMETTVDKTTIGLVNHIREGIVGRGIENYAFVEKESVSNKNDALQYFNEKVKTVFVTGQPSSASVIKMEEIQGSSSYSLFKTETDLKEGREGLATNFGFNQKRFIFLGSILTPNVRDYVGLFDLKESVFPRFDEQTAYGLAKQEKMNFKFSNLNKFLDLNVSVHLIEMRDREFSNSRLFDFTFHKEISKPSTKDGRIPEKYQLQNVEIAKNGDTIFNKSVICSKRAKLEMSAAFRQNAKVIRTFKKRLNAGLIWELDLRVNLGPGICLDQAFYDNVVLRENDESQPSTYAIVLECVGVDTTLVEAKKGGKQEHIGTSAGSICWEASKSIEVVNSDVTLGNAGFENSKAAIKLYRKDISTSQVFNVNFDKIKETEVQEGFYIPIRTDKDIKEGGPI